MAKDTTCDQSQFRFHFSALSTIFISAIVVSIARGQTPPATKTDGKVAVIVDAGDIGGLDESMADLERRARETYEALGFRVLVLGGAKGSTLSPEELKSQLSSLSKVSDLRVDFIGHGGIGNVPGSRFSGSEVQLSSDRLAHSDPSIGAKKPGEKTIWVAGNASTADVTTQYYADKAALFGLTPTYLKPVSLDDVADAVIGFTKKNPDAIAAINLLNCFSGVVAQRLRNAANVIVFDNSPPNQTALELAEYINPGSESPGFIRARDGLSYYYDALASPSRDSESLMEARTYANTQLRRDLFTNAAMIYHAGRSPVLESALGWCEQNKPGRLNSDSTLTSEDKRGPAALQIIVEQAGLESFWNFARRSPDPSDPSKLAVDVMKSDYDQCLKDARDSNNQTSSAGPSKIALLHDAYRNSPRKPLNLLFDLYDRALNDPAQHARIFAAVKESTENDLRSLETDKLPKSRWGSIGRLIDGLNNGTIGQAAVIESLKSSVKKMRSDCAAGPINQGSCGNWNDTAIQALLGIILPDGDNDQTTKCPKAMGHFECTIRGTPGTMALSELNYYWGFQESALQSPSEICGGTPWTELQSADWNIKADKACIDDFVKRAPPSEWTNLDRLLKLGSHDARGRTQTSGEAKTKTEAAP